MSKKRKYHIPGIVERLQAYTDSRSLDFHKYSAYHMRIMDGGYTVLDIWTTGRYYILTTDYLAMIGSGIVERYAFKGFDLTKYKGVDKRKLIRNCVDPQSGLHVFAASQGTHYHAKGIELVALDLELL